jgi:hypothetical protein
MEAKDYTETSVGFQQATWRYIPEDSIICNRKPVQ